MKAALAAALLCAAFSAPAMAGPPSAAQSAEFHATCMRIASNETLCTCKAEAAGKLIDAAFMDVLIGVMKGGTLEAKHHPTCNSYIAQSNHVCNANN